MPEWLQPLLDRVEIDPEKRWRDSDIRALGLAPERVRRWFQSRHGITFHAYSRARRLGKALGHMKNGHSVTEAAFDSGFESLSGFSEALNRWIGESPSGARDAAIVYLDRIATPVGPMLAGATDSGVCLLEFTDRRMLETQMNRIRKALACAFLPAPNEWIRRLETQLGEWFQGSRTTFDVPLELAGTPFQEKVWRALLEIPYGRTASYADVARTIGNPAAVRAVARANGDNRMAILVPCHRVIGSDGSLTGYGGGLWRKKRLLELEKGFRTRDLFE